MNVQRGHVRLDLDQPSGDPSTGATTYRVTRGGLDVGEAWTKEGETWFLRIGFQRFVGDSAEDVAGEAAQWLYDEERVEGVLRALERGQIR